MPDFVRSFPLEDIRIRPEGDGRTVEAYAAVFDTPVEITDHDGTYLEQISRGAFNKTIADNGTRFGVLFNHGLTIYGTPSDRGSMPIGTPLEVRTDDRGVVTVTRYNKTPLADEALEGIRSGAITAQSFQGRFIASDRKAPRGGWRRASDGTLTTVTRTEIAMKEYGPAVFAAYPSAAITGVRSLPNLEEMTEDQRAELLAGLQTLLATRTGPASDSPTPDIDGAGVGKPTASHLARWNHYRMKAREDVLG